LELGLHRQETFLRQDLIVVSPGVPWDLPQLVVARQRKVRVVPEVEAASWFLKGRLVGITGSNGKTTTTTLLGRMLEASGFETLVGGNIGVPLISLVDRTSADTISVAELSSFQLEAAQDFRADVGVLLNITPNHLDRHPSFDTYVAAKAGIFRNQTETGCAVLNADDPAAMSLAPAISNRKVLFSLRQDIPDGLLVSDGEIVYRVNNLERVLMDVGDVRLRGAFNLENVLAATAAACVLGADLEVLPRVVRDFRGVEHRLEYVRQIRGVDFYNDSKATSVDATSKALSAFQHGVHLILGGKDKGAPYAPLRPLLEHRVRQVLLIGAAAGRIEEELTGAADLVRAGDLETAVREAFRVAVPGDTVLLAPACASFDQFEDFEHRGRVFKEIVERLAAREKALVGQLEARGRGVSPVETHGQEIGNWKLETGSPEPEIEDSSRLEIGKSKVKTGNSTLQEPVEPFPSPEESSEGRDTSFQRTISNQQSPMTDPPVVNRPQLVYVYEVAAEELAPLESEPSEQSGGEAYEESDLLRSFPSAETDYEPLPYEVTVAGLGRCGQDARPTAGETPAPPPADSGTGSQVKSNITARESGTRAPGAKKSGPRSGGGSNSTEGGGGQGRLF
jgi:UDP-N-acetylmuramoylalanine--D-glutamate ligase